MKRELKKKMDEVIEKDLNEISEMDVGTRERAQAVSTVKELYDSRVEEDKNQATARSALVGNLLNFGGKVLEVGAYCAMTGILFVSGLEFEKSGNIPTSYFVKQVVSKPFRR